MSSQILCFVLERKTVSLQFEQGLRPLYSYHINRDLQICIRVAWQREREIEREVRGLSCIGGLCYVLWTPEVKHDDKKGKMADGSSPQLQTGKTCGDAFVIIAVIFLLVVGI